LRTESFIPEQSQFLKASYVPVPLLLGGERLNKNKLCLTYSCLTEHQVANQHMLQFHHFDPKERASTLLRKSVFFTL
jgi:hypothetical protein